MSTFIARNLSKFYEEYNFENGCQPNTGGMFEVNAEFLGKSTDEVIQKIANYLGVEKDGIEKNACDEPGRVDFALTEDDDSIKLSKSQIALWKQGKLRAWYAVYTAYIEEVTPAKI